MLWLYFDNVGTSEFAKKSNEWANFGQYFGSITGLLAFAGVLYTAALSEERAKKAEEEMRKREGREQFFKLLELLQSQNVDSVALDKHIKKIENRFFIYMIEYFITNISETSWEVFYSRFNDDHTPFECQCVESQIIYLLSKINYNNQCKYLPPDQIEKEINLSFLKKHITFDFIRREERNLKIFKTNCLNRSIIENLLNYSGCENPKKNFYNFIKNANKGFYLSFNDFIKFCKTCIIVLDHINNCDKETRNIYLETLRSQLKSNELILLFLYSLTEYSNRKIVQIVIDNNVFSNICYDDFILINDPKLKGNEGNYLVEILKYYLEDRNTF